MTQHWRMVVVRRNRNGNEFRHNLAPGKFHFKHSTAVCRIAICTCYSAIELLHLRMTTWDSKLYLIDNIVNRYKIFVPHSHFLRQYRHIYTLSTSTVNWRVRSVSHMFRYDPTFQRSQIWLTSRDMNLSKKVIRNKLKIKLIVTIYIYHNADCFNAGVFSQDPDYPE